MCEDRPTLSKNCMDRDNAYRPHRYFLRARDAFGAILDAEGIGPLDGVLLPAYIGWSPKEGSGVFDPIVQRGIVPVFYRMDGRLQIDLDDLCRKLQSDARIKAILLIHYFGFVDSRLREAVAAARSRGILVIEDAAHALYTDYVHGSCGRQGDYTIYSLHKMLPLASGGMAAFQTRAPRSGLGSERSAYGDPFSYDLAAIASKREENYRCLQKLLAPLAESIVPLFETLQDGITPQTFPARVLKADRFQLYRRMNEAGYGVVSLYHTLIEPLRLAQTEWQEELALAGQIINLPVHQDVDPGLYEGMIRTLARLFKEI